VTWTPPTRSTSWASRRYSSARNGTAAFVFGFCGRCSSCDLYGKFLPQIPAMLRAPSQIGCVTNMSSSRFFESAMSTDVLMIEQR